jgi:hypothetical protein
VWGKRTANKNESICDQSCRRQRRKISDHAEREHDDELCSDQPLCGDKGLAVGDGEDEGLKVFSDKDRVCCS